MMIIIIIKSGYTRDIHSLSLLSTSAAGGRANVAAVAEVRLHGEHGRVNLVVEGDRPEHLLRFASPLFLPYLKSIPLSLSPSLSIPLSLRLHGMNAFLLTPSVPLSARHERARQTQSSRRRRRECAQAPRTIPFQQIKRNPGASQVDQVQTCRGRCAPLGGQKSLKPRHALYTLTSKPQPDRKHV